METSTSIEGGEGCKCARCFTCSGLRILIWEKPESFGREFKVILWVREEGIITEIIIVSFLQHCPHEEMV